MRNRAQLSTVAAVVALVVLSGCSAKEHAYESRPAAPAVAAQPRTASVQSDMRNVRRTASLSMRAPDPEKAEAQIQHVLDEVGGFMQESSLNKQSGRASLQATLRVPVDRFQESMAKVSALGHVQSKSVSAEDVTAELALLRRQALDVEARRRAIEARVKAEGGSADLSAQLGALDEQARALGSSAKDKAATAAFSTIVVSVEQQMGLEPGQSDPNWFQNEAGSALASLGGNGKLLLGALIWVLVYTPVWRLGLLLCWGAVKLASRATSGHGQTPAH